MNVHTGVISTLKSTFKSSAAYIGIVGKAAMKEKYYWQTMLFILI